MALPSGNARLHSIEGQRRHVLAHPLARGIAHEEVARHFAALPLGRFPSVAYSRRGRAP